VKSNFPIGSKKRCCNFQSVWAVLRAWQTVEICSRAGGQKATWLHKSLPLQPHVPPRSGLAPREAGGGLALGLIGKKSSQRWKNTCTKPSQPELPV